MKSALFFFLLAASALAETRDPWLWPFATESIWNTPIGDGARYEDEGFLPAPPGLLPDTEYFYKVAANDPERPLLQPGSWEDRAAGAKQLRTLRLPDELLLDNARPGYTPNNAAAFLMPDGRTIEQLEPFLRKESGGPVYGIPRPFWGGVDIRGPGIVGTHWGSGMSAMGGSLRHGELTGAVPIRHALKLEVWGRKFLRFDKKDPTPGFRWPADLADSYASLSPEKGGYGGTNPRAEMGALLAIHPRHTETSLGLKSAPGKLLFHALQNYGGYLVDDSAADTPSICVESHALGEFREVFGYDFEVQIGVTGPAAEWLADVRTLFTALSIVDNNAAETVGGGGTRRAPAAPDFGGFDTTTPTMPERLTAGKIAARSVALTWTPARDDVRVMAYEIFSSGKQVGLSNGHPSLAITGLTPDSAHHFTIRARDTSMNASPFSTPVTVRTPPLPPGTYEDDFGGDLAGWKLEKAKGELGKLLLQNWQGDAAATLAGPRWSAPFTLRCDLELAGSGLGNKAFIRFNHRDDKNSSWLEIAGKGPDAMLSLHQTVNGETKKLAEHRGWNGDKLEIAREATGAITARLLDGATPEVIFERILAPSIEPGTIGFRTSFQQLSVDNLTITPP